MPQSVFFQPTDAWVGDVIPYVDGGEFQLFYLYEDRSEPKPGTPWHLVTTKDAVELVDQGLAFDHGSPTEPDFNIYTGSVVQHDGVHHLFYTGQNPAHLGQDGLPLQLVMHATSEDGMASWTRHPDHTFGATPGYESGDWRDPFVFRDEEAGVWRMLIAARHVDGPERRRGVIAQCVSQDLVHWEPTTPFWDPRRYIAHECPEVFRWGGWWYLVYSEFSESFTTRYRMARDLAGPWLVPEHDTLDGRAFYAAKSAERDGRRFFFGWIASREGGRDDGAWQWAGTLSTLEATQRADGTLAFSLPAEILESFTDSTEVRFRDVAPDTTRSDVAPEPLARLELAAPDGYRAVVGTEDLPEQVRVSVTLDVAPGTRECGLLLRADPDGDRAYVLRLEPQRGRMVLDRWPRRVTGPAQWQVSGDVPFVIELERPCHLPAGPHTVEVVLEGDLCVATLDGAVTLSTRLYDRPAGRLGVFVGEGSVVVTSCSAATRPDTP